MRVTAVRCNLCLSREGLSLCRTYLITDRSSGCVRLLVPIVAILNFAFSWAHQTHTCNSATQLRIPSGHLRQRKDIHNGIMLSRWCISVIGRMRLAAVVVNRGEYRMTCQTTEVPEANLTHPADSCKAYGST